MDVSNALESLSALAHETRLWVFRLLVQAGPGGLSAGDIADRLCVRQNTMSSHLQQLHRAGLIDSHRDGRKVIFIANYDTAQELIVFLMDDCCAANQAVCKPVAESIAQSCK